MTDLSSPPAPANGNGNGNGNGKRRIHKRHLAVAAAIVLLVGGSWGMQRHLYNATHVTTDDAQVGADIYPVSARISGYVRRVLVQTNERVHAGQLLAEVDPTDYQVALEQAQAALAQASSAAGAAGGTVSVTRESTAAGLQQAIAGQAAAAAAEQASERQRDSAAEQISVARAEERAAAAAVEAARRQIIAAEAAHTSAVAKAKEAHATAGRVARLLAEGAVSAQQRDQAEAADVTAQSAVESAQAQLEAAQAGLQQAQSKQQQAHVAVHQAEQRLAAAAAAVAQAEAGVRQAQSAVLLAKAGTGQTGVRRAEAGTATQRIAEARARLHQAQLNLGYTRIVAPTDGVVAQKNVEPGQFVSPGTPLMAVVADRSAYLEANFKETQLADIRPGDRATFRIDAYPGTVFRGHVRSLSPGTGAVFSLLPPENASGNFTKVVQRVPVRIQVDGRPDRVLRAGMSAVVTVETRPR